MARKPQSFSSAPANPGQPRTMPAIVQQPQLQTPSQSMIEEQTTLEVVDRAGRKIVWHSLDFLEEFKLLRVVGDAADGYKGLARLVCGVRQIGEMPLSFPSSESQLDARVKLVGTAGANALYVAITAESETADEDEGSDE
ncbi:hypothetical protein ACELLULO517_15775 [Acidisoma cellulosilytica]|uniref:Uncharacterized protein n=1 Tax=Acidisoma cellulosilyticum TaxID=2802395 RepID=A0A963Z2L1_9PROT|nr:hypothetical protein [Acidisoma cellulosilyticum]MCB8881707.1 hypothetical protein [Acidisoma cellulosilyticum]